MAKSSIPGLKSSGGVLPKLIGGAVLVALLVMVVKFPSDSATFVQAGASAIGDVIDGLVSFFRSFRS